MAAPVSPAPRLVPTLVRPGEREALAHALANAGLTVDDLDEPGRLFWRYETGDDLPVGYGGLEIHDRDALMRSIVTLPPARRHGVGAAIVAALEVEAAALGARAVWLLTTSAAAFFVDRGYAVVERAAVPEAIRATRQFAQLCPASATVLVKRVG